MTQSCFTLLIAGSNRAGSGESERSGDDGHVGSGSLLAGYLMPHPPVIVPGVDSGRVKAGQTIKAMQQLASDLAKLKPDTVVLISPHAPLFSDYLFVYDEQILYGDLSAFGAPEARLSLHQDQELLGASSRAARNWVLPPASLNASQMGRFNIDRSLDHGAVVPCISCSKRRRFSWL
jgi:aromatic ring-opening dioxygenase LigB subunit